MKYSVSGMSGAEDFSVPVSQARFEEIKSFKAVCLFAWELEEKLALLLDNFYEFEVELLKLAEQSVIWPNHDFQDSMERRLSLDRRIVNVLTSCRLYQDQTDHGISMLYGSESAELKKVKQFKAKLFDEQWGYRFMEALRNHVQHAGLPVHVISHTFARRPGIVEDHWEYTVIPQSDAKTLAENPKFKKSVLEELQTKGKVIDLRRPSRDYVTCFLALHRIIQETISGRVITARNVYDGAIAEFSTNKGVKVFFAKLLATNNNGEVVEQIALTPEFLASYDSLRKKNDISSNLPFQFASNRDQKTS
jgi:hypothetical protein